MENMIIKAENSEISAVESLAAEVRYYSDSMFNNMFQLGRALKEAKALVKHGEWTSWVMKNSGFSTKMAQNFMAAYEQFGHMPQLQNIEKSKLFKMLSLPEGTEEKFVEEHDISAMTAREVEEAVRKVKMEMKGAVEAAESRAREAENLLDEMRNTAPAPDPKMVDEIRFRDERISELRQSLERQAQVAQDAINTANELRKNDSNRELKEEIAKLHVRLDAANRDLEATEQERDTYKSQLLNAESDKAKGDTERNISERLSGDEFLQAVRMFIGTCATIPHMGRTFATMDDDEHGTFATGIDTIKAWLKSAEKAVSSVKGEIVGE